MHDCVSITITRNHCAIITEIDHPIDGIICHIYFYLLRQCNMGKIIPRNFQLIDKHSISQKCRNRNM